MIDNLQHDMGCCTHYSSDLCMETGSTGHMGLATTPGALLEYPGCKSSTGLLGSTCNNMLLLLMRRSVAHVVKACKGSLWTMLTGSL